MKSFPKTAKLAATPVKAATPAAVTALAKLPLLNPSA